jgi:hypothetical protein
MKTGAVVQNAKQTGVCVESGTFTLEGGTISANGIWYNHQSNMDFKRFDGGGLYVSDGATLCVTADSTISANHARTGGGLYLACGAQVSFENDATLTLTQNDAVSNGGGLYISENRTASGTGTATDSGTEDTGHTLTLGSNYVITKNEAENGAGIYDECQGELIWNGAVVTENTASVRGGALYVANGTAEFTGGAGTNSAGNAASEGTTLYLAPGANFLHESGVMSGIACVQGSYTVNVEEGTLKVTEGIDLLNEKYPLQLKGASVNMSPIEIRASSSFLSGSNEAKIVVQGNDAYATKEIFVVSGIDVTVKEHDLISATSQYVFWDPSGICGVTEENEMVPDTEGNIKYDGTSPSRAVYTFERSKELLKKKGRDSCIVVCSICQIGYNPYRGKDQGIYSYDLYIDFDGLITGDNGETWNATLIRGVDSKGIALTDAMFDFENQYATVKMENMTLSGKFSDGTENIASALIYTTFHVDLTVDHIVCKDTRGVAAISAGSDGSLKVQNSTFENCYGYDSGGAISSSSVCEISSSSFKKCSAYEGQQYIVKYIAILQILILCQMVILLIIMFMVRILRLL